MLTELLTAIVTSVPAWVRLTLALIALTLGILLFFGDVRAGAVVTGAGVVLLAFSGKSRSEKDGYNF
jgi:hypothetical protein